MKKLFLLFGMVGWWLGAGIQANPQEQLEAETRKRESLVAPLQAALKNGDNLARQGDVEEAVQVVQKAYEELPEGLRQSPAAQKAQRALGQWNASLAATAANQQRWPEARNRALASLQSDPRNESARQTLQDSDAILRRGTVGPEDVNPALTPKFFDRLNGVQAGLKKAGQLQETGQLDRAEKAYEEVLALDPFNRAATEGIRKIYEERAFVAEKSRDVSNLQRRREVREAWNNIYPRKSSSAGGIEIAGPMTASPNFGLEQKLKKTVIPELDFTGADLETVRRALNSLSRTYDPSAEKTGVNFVISAEVANAQPINLRLRQASLGDVVRYVAEIAGVKARLTEVGITFGPLVETRPELIARNFEVSPSFFKDTSDGGAEVPPLRGGRGEEPLTEGATLSEQAKLEALGVQFPPGAYAIYNQNTAQLKVVNNAEMLDLIGQLISAAEEETLLIQVGVRLIEINQADLDSITVNSTLSGSATELLSPIPVGLLANSTGLTPDASNQQGVTAQLNQIQGVGLLPNNTLQSFLQPNVLAGTNQTSAYSLNTMELGGSIMGGTQFRTLITAIAQKSSANVLASPSIVLQRGGKGVIEVTQEFKYVQEYNDPQSSIRTIIPPGGAVFDTGVPGPETVIGSFPSQISDPVPIGVKMGIEADIAGDNSRVSMELKPTFIDFEGFINYGTPINSAFASTYYDTTVTILTNNIQQPVFVRRDLTIPSVEVSDGYTLLLGGLLREDIQKVDEKVPLLGDIPFLGRGFQGKTEQAVKKNTLIFVTPRILRVDGQPLNPTAGSPTTASASGPP